MPAFWHTSGYDLLEPNDDGHLLPTDAFLRAYLQRPELAPIDESCDAERRLHARLIESPRSDVAADDVAGIADADARENYRFMLDFRDHVLARGTIEAAYLGAFEPGAPALPPIFLDHLAQIILHHALREVSDPFRVRGAELLFREQRISIQDGVIMAADAGTVAARADAGFGALGRLVVEAGTPLADVELDIMTDANAKQYWGRSDNFDTVLDLRFGGPGLDAFARVLETWVAHLLGAEVSVQPVEQITDERWVWHVGLDAEATAILNALYAGEELGEDRLRQILSLFRLEFADPQLMQPDIAGRPVYLAMAMTDQGRLRLKPQNLLINLPLAGAS